MVKAPKIPTPTWEIQRRPLLAGTKGSGPHKTSQTGGNGISGKNCRVHKGTGMTGLFKMFCFSILHGGEWWSFVQMMWVESSVTSDQRSGIIAGVPPLCFIPVERVSEVLKSLGQNYPQIKSWGQLFKCSSFVDCTTSGHGQTL